MTHSQLLCCIVWVVACAIPVKSLSVASPVAKPSEEPVSFNMRHGLTSRNQNQKLDLAVLISGQEFRFTYKDAFRNAGHLKGVVCPDPSLHPDWDCSFDVFVMISQTKVDPNQASKASKASRVALANEMVPNGGLILYSSEELNQSIDGVRAALDATCIRHPPYESSDEAIRSFFADEGANHVDIHFLSVDDFDKRVRERDELVEEMASSALNMTLEDWKAAISDRDSRGVATITGNMLFLRHLSYASARAAESTLNKRYTHFLCLREDNAFVKPVQSLWFFMQQVHSKMVMVDNHCGWGAKSDKIYLAGRTGASVLFSSSLEKHVRDMSTWLNWAMQGGRIQGEAWLAHLMASSGLDVQDNDFHRVDLRYINAEETPCVPQVYFGCTAHPGEIYRRCGECWQ